MNFMAMKNSLYIIAVLLLVIWGIIFWGLHAAGPVHFLLVAAGLIILVRLVFSKQLSK
jgi:predicted neutral ceramidase superfamily lipid hydrolase